MKYRLNIREYNLAELKHEERLMSNENDLFDCSPRREKKDKLGFANFKLENSPPYTIVEMNNMFYEDVVISAYSAEPMLSLDFRTKGTIGYGIKNSDTIVSNSGSNNIWLLNEGRFGRSFFKKDEYCSGFAIYLNLNFLEELTHKYPEILSDIYISAFSGKTICLNPKYQFTTMEMIQIIAQIRNAKLIGRSSQMYTEAKILELLALQLQNNTYYNDKNCYRYCKNISDIEKVHEAKRILIADLNKPISIRQLARQVGTNENKLKYCFKEIYNTTIFGFLFDYKMELACKLLLDTNKSILNIAQICGYEYSSHFATAFKRKFGVSPKEYRIKK